MKRRSSVVVTFLMSMTCLCGISARASMSMEAGGATVALHFPAGTSIAGYANRRLPNNIKPSSFAHYLRPSTGVNDDIRVKAIELKIEGVKYLFASIDVVAVSEELAQALAIKIRDLGIAEGNIFLYATHTHAGPGGYTHGTFWERLAIDKFVPEIFDVIVNGLDEMARTADENLKPAQVAISFGSITGVTENRRGQPTLDPTFTFLQFTDFEGQNLGQIINFPIHGNVLHSDNLLLSGDVPGAIERKLSEKLSGTTVFINGAEGDVAPKSEHATYTDAIRLADAISDSVILQSENTIPADLGEFSIIRSPVTVGSGRFNVAACVASTGWSGSFLLGLNTLAPDTAPMSAFSINNHLFINVPGELTSEMGLAVKSQGLKSGFETASILGLSGSYLGYILTTRDYLRGGYEACASLYGPRLGDTILKHSEVLITDLQAKIMEDKKEVIAVSHTQGRARDP